MIAVVELLKAILYGIVEGITEWLPVSSTGHLILLGEWLPFGFTKDPVLLSEFGEMFEVVIQLGTILAVVVMFWHKLWPFSKRKSAPEKKETWSLWLKVVIASVPAAAMGILGDKLIEKMTGKDIDGWIYNATVVAIALIVYGVAFIVIERFQKPDRIRVETTADITCKDAFFIGLFQMLSMVPGTSRSGSTILGSMLMGISRPAAAEFSFFMAIPVMVGASGIKVLGFLSFRQSYLMGFDFSNEDLAFPTPRSWEMVSNLLHAAGEDTEKLYPLIAGLVGSGAAIEFRTWARIYADLPRIEDIFDGKMPPLPGNSDAMYALAASITAYAREHRHETARLASSIRYIDRMPPDFSALVMRDYMCFEPDFKHKLMAIPEFARWLQTKGKLLNGAQ